MHSYSDLFIGNWYKSPEIKEAFEIVAMDPEEDCIEIQYYNGQIDEFDLESWNNLGTSEIECPRDWTGSYEMSKEDIDEYKDDVIHPENHNNPLSSLDFDEDNM